MKTALLLLLTVSVFSCGGQQRDSRRVVKYDPELLELCYQSRATAVKPVCERAKVADGKKEWVRPSNPTREMEVFLGVNALDTHAARQLAEKLIQRGIQSDDAQLSCEGQIARYERGRSSMKKGEIRDAFLDFAFIVKSGPHHYKYDEMKVVLKKLRPLMAAGTVSVCLAEIYNRK